MAPSWAQIYRHKIHFTFFFFNEIENSPLSTGREFSFLESVGALMIPNTYCARLEIKHRATYWFFFSSQWSFLLFLSPALKVELDKLQEK